MVVHACYPALQGWRQGNQKFTVELRFTVWYQPELYNTSREQGGKLHTWFAFKFWFYSCWCDFSFYVFLMSIRWGYFVGYHIWVGGGGNGYYTHSVKGNTWCRMNTPRMLTKPSRWITRSISLSHAIPASLFYNTQIKKKSTNTSHECAWVKTEAHRGMASPAHPAFTHCFI